MHKLVCMMGLPRSGKSTAARKLSQAVGAPIVNRDSIRLALHGQRYQGLAEPMVKAIAIVMVRALFNVGHRTVIVDETCVNRGTRDFWRDQDWDTEILLVPTPIGVCVKRAQAMGDMEIQPVICKMNDAMDPLEDDEVRFSFDAAALSYPGMASVLEAIAASVAGVDMEVDGGSGNGAAG